MSKSLPASKRKPQSLVILLGEGGSVMGMPPRSLGFHSACVLDCQREETEHSASHIPSPFYSLLNTVLNTEKHCFNAHDPRFSEEKTEAHRG